MFVCRGGGGSVLLCAQRLYFGRDQLDCYPPNGINHYLPLNKPGAHSTRERFRATMGLFSNYSDYSQQSLLMTLRGRPWHWNYAIIQQTVRVRHTSSPRPLPATNEANLIK